MPRVKSRKGKEKDIEKIKIERWADDYKKNRFSVSLNFSKGSFIRLLVLFVATVVLFVLCPYLIFEDPPSGRFPFIFKNVLMIGAPIFLIIVLIFLKIKTTQAAHRSVTLVSFCIVPLLCVIAAEWINDTYLIQGTTPINKWLVNYLCYLFFMALFYAIFRSITVASAITTIITIVFAVANYYTLAFRGIPILPWDFSALGTAMDVVGGYEFILTARLTSTIYFTVFVNVLISRLAPGRTSLLPYQNILERGISSVLAVLVFLLLFPLNFMETIDVKVWPWDQRSSLKITGVMGNFVGNMQFMFVEKPQGYSIEAVGEIAEELSEQKPLKALGNPDKPPTIIAIMNESFADLEAASEGRITLTEDNMPYIHSILESGEVIHGTSYASVFGGNTCDSEYEFLTGNTTAFMPNGSKPYQQYINSPQTSLVSILKEDYGYDAIAIHPGSQGAWNRDSTYNYFGFDKFVYRQLFEEADNLETEHSIVSDRANYNQVIYEYENRDPDKPLFIFDVTIQNHGGYEDPTFKNFITLEGEENTYVTADQYLSLIKKSDDYFKELMEYFENVEEPVVFVFFGDHWPRLEEAFTKLVLGVDSLENLPRDTIMKQYQVPYFIMANYPLEAQEIETVSMNYLSGLLLRSAGFEVSPYQQFLDEFHETFPAFTDIGMIDKDGNSYRQGESTPYDDLINKYAILQYNQAFDDENRVDELFSARDSK